MFNHEPPPDFLNETIDIVVKANSFASAITAKPGTLISGEKGLEFRTESGAGYIQMPWSNINLVRADVYGKHVRGIEVHTDTSVPLSFTVTDGPALLRSIRDHIGRDKMQGVDHNLPKLFHKKGKAAEKDEASVAGASSDDGGPKHAR
ncbi:MAG: DUF956 family protein [Atopobiaceae bacterium]|jgi:hypothetical protein|nr:DUF956 family protein [Atopobiaceae bacterium]MCH4180454.1 DUF956 family protein [Atopobiaceae bacterium]MCH4214591.1 DUF956 family protein [Atopobiaceae bacterium]MCH4275814.1 DUF956 family protein [Atopobiaceae bacterium]MCI1225822.1 DUF956 family protein [Atopobiaceae bacterium]